MANNFSADSNCVALYRFENGALTTDAKGTNTLTSNGTPVSDTTNYKEGAGAVDLERGDVDYYSIADASLASGFPGKSGETNSTFSVCFWYRPEAGFVTSENGCATKYGTTGNKRTWKVVVLSTKKPTIVIGYNSGASGETFTHDSILTAGQWYHIGVTYNGSTRDYVIRVWDDTAVAILGTDKTGTGAQTMSITDAPFHVGTTADAASPVDGILDELVIFNDVLTTAEIDQIRAGTYGAGGGTTITATIGNLGAAGVAFPMGFGIPVPTEVNP